MERAIEMFNVSWTKVSKTGAYVVIRTIRKEETYESR